MDLLMKLLIKPMWRGVFQMYPFDFKRKSIALTNYPPLSAISILLGAFYISEKFSSKNFLLKKLLLQILCTFPLKLIIYAQKYAKTPLYQYHLSIYDREA